MTAMSVGRTLPRELRPDKVKLAKLFGASRRQILTKIVLRGSEPTMISTLKISVGSLACRRRGWRISGGKGRPRLSDLLRRHDLPAKARHDLGRRPGDHFSFNVRWHSNVGVLHLSPPRAGLGLSDQSAAIFEFREQRRLRDAWKAREPFPPRAVMTIGGNECRSLNKGEVDSSILSGGPS
jgi:hypothetical protein